MERKLVLISVIVILFTSLFCVAFRVEKVQASGTIYIRADGSIDPPTANITTTNNVTYTFTDNNYDSIVVERSNIIVDGAGYTLQGSGSGNGFDWSGINNVTIKHTNIINFSKGIWLIFSSSSSILGNNITNDWYGIGLDSSSSSSILGNNITNNDYGIRLDSSSNNSISGNNITNNDFGITLDSSSNNSISGNNITNNDFGIYLSYSSSNSISGNTITANNAYGICLFFSSSNSILGNNITNDWYGIWLYSSSNYNSISGNNITANDCYGIRLDSSSSNSVFHNNLINNTNQLYSSYSVNIWDDGYPSGGNYWSDYTDADSYKGADQNEIGSDGVWDHPYIVDEDNQDRFPLTKPYGGPAGDVDDDHDVDIFDIVRMAGVYGVTYPNPQYDRLCDMDLDGDIDIFDIVAAATHYGESW